MDIHYCFSYVFFLFFKDWKPHLDSTKEMRDIGAIFLVVSTSLLMLTELLCYISLFKKQLANNKTVENLLSQAVIRKRKKNNAVSMLGQFLTWLASGWYIGIGTLISYVIKSDDGREIAVVFRLSQFSIIPAIEIMTSPPLRTYFKRFFKWVSAKLCWFWYINKIAIVNLM